MSDAPKNSVEQWLKGKTAAELERIEHGGRIHYPDHVKRRNAADLDKLDEDPVYLRVPNPLESMEAKLEAIAFVRARTHKDIITEESARQIIGDVVWADIDLYHQVAKCVFKRNENKIGSQYLLPEFWLESVPRGTVLDIWDRVKLFFSLEDVRVSKLSADDAKEVVRAIARVGNLTPLLAIDGAERERFILSMAFQLASLPTSNASSLSPETSTQEP